MAAVVPSISSAAIQAIKDPNVQKVVRALADGVALRNGDVGTGDQAFLTVADLRGNKGKALEVAKALAGPMAQGVSAHGELAAMADALRDRIMKSPYWLAMFSRLERITAPDNVPGSAARMLLLEARERRAAITRVDQTIQLANESLASTREVLTAAIGDTAAAISLEKTARATAEESFAKQLSLMISSTGQSFAGIQDELEVRTNNDNALARAINTIWARVGTREALVQEGTEIAVNDTGSAATAWQQLQATAQKGVDDAGRAIETVAAVREELTITNSTVSGMAGKWSVKLDLNGYVSGLSLNAGVTPDGKSESMFLVAAEVFAIGAPGKPNIVPFAIDARTGLVAIDGSLIATGTIAGSHISAESIGRGHIALKAVGGAQIDDLAVDTLQIKGNAVTIPVTATASNTVEGIGRYVWRDALSVTFDMPQDGFLYVHGMFAQNYGQGMRAWNAELLIDGQSVWFCGGESVETTPSVSASRHVTAGKHTVTMRWSGEYGVRINHRTLFCQLVLR